MITKRAELIFFAEYIQDVYEKAGRQNYPGIVNAVKAWQEEFKYDEAEGLTAEESEKEVYEALTVQLLQLRNEIYSGAGMSKDEFDNTYLNSLGEYERKLAKREGIPL